MSTPTGVVAGTHSLDPGLKTYPRRRTIITDHRSNVETVPEGVSDGKAVSGRDLSHSVRGETLTERPKDLPPMRKTLIDSTISPRKRKPAPKPEKPWWKTVLSVLIKNLLLLLMLSALGRMVWKLFENSENGSILSVGVLDFEGRISEVEQFLKTTAKKMQVQVDAVNRKFEGELGNLKMELIKRYDERTVLVERELKKLGARTDNLDKSLAEIREMGFFSKEDFDNFLSELKKNKDLEGDRTEFSADEVRAYAREIVQKEMEKHAADGLGRLDYALASSGAKVVKHSEPFINQRGSSSWFCLSKTQSQVHESAKKMLESSFGEPGHCFALKGSSGFVEVRLRTAIVPEAITLEHVAKSVAYDRCSAPKDCRISGWLQAHENDASAQRSLLVEFTYDLEKSNAQTFNVMSDGASPINTVRLDFSSNHGSTSYTCIYRLRVHGYEPAMVASLPVGSA